MAIIANHISSQPLQDLINEGLQRAMSEIRNAVRGLNSLPFRGIERQFQNSHSFWSALRGAFEIDPGTSPSPDVLTRVRSVVLEIKGGFERAGEILTSDRCLISDDPPDPDAWGYAGIDSRYSGADYPHQIQLGRRFFSSDPNDYPASVRTCGGEGTTDFVLQRAVVLIHEALHWRNRARFGRTEGHAGVGVLYNPYRYEIFILILHCSPSRDFIERRLRIASFRPDYDHFAGIRYREPAHFRSPIPKGFYV